ncbi:hypothetical protein ACSLNR_28915, partial [Escherichia coli]|uniref:hypothetical protein n=1 Tax=Escherichia coli TaxID=562 RepID=UPI003EDED87F
MKFNKQNFSLIQAKRGKVGGEKSSGGITDGNGSHGSTSKTPLDTKPASWHHHKQLLLLEKKHYQH